METIVPAERCYRCLTPLASAETYCGECGLPVDPGAFRELASLDFVRATITRWQAEGLIHPMLGGRLASDTDRRHERILAPLLKRQRVPSRQGYQAMLPLAERRTETPPPPQREPIAPPVMPPTPPAPPPIEVRPVALQPGPEVVRSADADRVVPDYSPAPPPVRVEIPVSARQDPTPPPTPAAPRPRPRPLLDVLLDASTLRLMLYAGAVMLAVGTLLYLRDVLRAQLSRPEVQAGLLVIATTSILGTGITLVHRAGENFEKKMLGRAFLFLGTLLVPLTPWFFVRAGLVESRGNAWVVALLCFVLCTGIAFALGERAYVFLSFLSAALSGWLVTFKVTGAAGTAPGAYALVLAGIAAAYVHAERAVSRSRVGTRIERLGGPFFLCGHIGIATTLLFYTNLVPFLPPEVIAAFRHFDASGYSPWIGVAVSLVAAEVYFYSAARRENAVYTYLGIGAALWCVALWLWARNAPPGAWLTACGASALAMLFGNRAVRSSELWARPLESASRAVAWVGFVATIAPAAALAWDLARVRWFTVLGVAMVLAAFVAHAASTGRKRESFPMPILVVVLVAHALDAVGLAPVYAHAILALVVAAIPALAVRLLGDRVATLQGALMASAALTGFFVLDALGWAAVQVFADPEKAIPLAVATTAAVGVHAWGSSLKPLRYGLFGVSALLMFVAAALGAFAVAEFADIDAKYMVFLLAPIPYLFAVLWFMTRALDHERTGEISRVARASVSVTALVAACAATLLWSNPSSNALQSAAFAVLALPVLAVAVLEKSGVVAHAEAVFGSSLLLVAYDALADLIVERTAGSGLALGIVWGCAPFLFAVANRSLAGVAPAVASIARWFGDGLAYALLAVVAWTTIFDHASTLGTGSHAAPISLALLVLAYGSWRLAERDGHVWSVHVAATAILVGQNVLVASTVREYAALGLAAAATALFVSGFRFGQRERPSAAAAALVAGHGLSALALAHTAAVQPPTLPLAWRAIAVLSALAACHVTASAAGGAAASLARLEGLLGNALGLAAYCFVVERIAHQSPASYDLVLATGLGTAPLLFIGVRRLTEHGAEAVATTAGWVGDAWAVLLTVSSCALAVVGLLDARPASNSERIVLAALLALAWAIRVVETRHIASAVPLVAATFVSVHEVLMASAGVQLASLLVAAAAGALLASRGWLLARFDEVIANTVAVATHGMGLLALAHALSAHEFGRPVSWLFVALLGTLALGYAAAAIGSPRGSLFDDGHRVAAGVASFATLSAALHALGRMTPTSQAEPLAVALILWCAFAVFGRSQWARDHGVDLAHVLVIVLMLVVLSDQAAAFSGVMIWGPDGAWSALEVGRFAFELAVFYAIAAFRRQSAAVVAALVASAVSLAAFGVHLGVDPSARLIVFVALAAAVAEIARRLAGDELAWLARPLSGAAHATFWTSLAIALGLVLPAIVRVPVGTPNAELGQPVATFATLAACARVLASPSRGGQAAPVYALLARVLPFAAYSILGLRLGFHPWRDSAFYTLPAGAVLVALGVAGARRDEAGAAALLWTGSLLAAGPMLLHAFDNRFVANTSPFVYDAATIGVGLGLVIVGVLFQLKAPSVVGAVALCADVFVVVFSRIEWSEIPMAIYSVAVGGALFGFGWLLLYRREQLRRLLENLARRREAFARWR